jgi:catechol 2,3-dioxygenase-like lactoylglutathione lyase family enzyme
MHVSNIDHIVLNVEDVERSLAFYQGRLGLAAERVDAWRAGKLPFPSVRINESTIIDLVAAAPDGNGSRANLAHFCLVTDDEDLTPVIRDLTAAGVKIEEGPATRSGARGDALSIYFRDPDHNLIEVRTYARLAALGAELDNGHARLRAALDNLASPEAAAYDGWTKKDMIAHLTSIESRLREQIQHGARGLAWQPAEDVDTFNAREVSIRRGWTLDQLRDELDRQSVETRALLATLSEEDLDRPFDHPRRGRITVENLWRTIPRHLEEHMADLGKPTDVA